MPSLNDPWLDFQIRPGEGDFCNAIIRFNRNFKFQNAIGIMQEFGIAAHWLRAVIVDLLDAVAGMRNQRRNSVVGNPDVLIGSFSQVF